MSDIMKAQYHTLGELRKLEAKIARVQLDIERIPDEKEKLSTALQQRKQTFDKTRESFQDFEKKLRRAELDLKEKEDYLRKAEDKMREVKTNEEYQAAIKENETHKNDKKTLEEGVLRLLSETEAQKTGLQTAEGEFKTFEDAIKRDLAKLESERLEVVRTLEEIIARRNDIAAQLSSDVSNLYRRLSDRFRGFAVVSAENGMCLGCNMKIRPQLYNEILGYKAVHVCPSCGKIVIISSRDEAQPEAANLA